VLPPDWSTLEGLLKAKKKAKKAKTKAKAGDREFDPFGLIYPLFPENDNGDPMAFDNDGACMLPYESIIEQRERDGSPSIAEATTHTPVRAPCVCVCVCRPVVCSALCLFSFLCVLCSVTVLPDSCINDA